MSCIHYKFRSSLDYDTITFDGLSISLADLKREIMAKKKVGKNTDFGLEVTNAQTKEVYKDEATIPRNSSVVLRRVPMGTRSKAQLAADRADPCASGVLKTLAQKDLHDTRVVFCEDIINLSAIQDFQQVPATSKTLNKIADLANANASEEDKLKAMMSQAGEDWDPSQYQKGRRPYGGPLPTSYVCYRCGKNGHFIRNCPTNGDERFDLPKVKRTTGIPRTFFESGASSPSQEQKNDTQKPKTEASEKVLSAVSSRKKVPGELRCPMCKNLLSDAVLIPCCGTSYCDDCIRNCLLEHELQCPYCGTENVSPDSLVINKQLRQAVSTFRNARPGSPFTTTSLKGSASPVPDLADKPVADAKVNNVSDAEKVTPNNKNDAVKATDTKEPEKKPAEKASEVPKSEGDKSKQAPPAVTQPQPIKVRQPVVQAGPPHAGPKFEPHRRPEDFHPRNYHGPRGPLHLRDAPHNLRDPAMPHRIPPEQIPRVPALRPAHSIPHMVHPMTGYVPPASMPVHPPAVMLPIRLPHPVRHPFAPPMYDPLLPQGELPPMSEEEFYRLQKKLKHKTETRHKRKREVRGRSRSHSQERPEKSSRGRPERSRRDYAERARIQNSDRLKREVPEKSKQSGRTKRKGGGSDFADELFAYKELQRSRQEHSRSRSLSRSPSRSRSCPHSGSWSGSSSNSSPGLTRSPTPEDWDKSRSPSPAAPDSTKVPGEKKHKHKKRKKHQKDKSGKKQKTGHEDQTDGKKVLPSGTEGDAQTVEKTAKKKHKKHKEKDKVKGKAKEANMESDKKEKKISTGKEKEKEDSKTKEKKREKGSSKGKEKEKGKDQESSKDNGVEILPQGKESVKFKESSNSQDKSEVKESKSKDGTEAKTKDKSKSKDKHRRKSKDSESAKKHKSKKKHKKKHKHQKKKKSKSTASTSEENGTTLTETEKSEKESGHEAGADGGIAEQDPAEQESVSDQDESDEEDTVEQKDVSPEESTSKVTGEASSDAKGKAKDSDVADESIGEQGEGKVEASDVNSPDGDAELDRDADTKEDSDT